MSVKAVADIAFLSWLQIQRIESNEQTEQYTQESDTYREKCNGPVRAGSGRGWIVNNRGSPSGNRGPAVENGYEAGTYSWRS